MSIKISRVTCDRRFPRVSRSGFFSRAPSVFFLAIPLAALACRKDPVVDQRTVTLYMLTDPDSANGSLACVVPDDAYALYSAAGDFEPDPSSPPQTGTLLDVPNPPLDALPSAAAQFSIDVSLSSNRWRGFERIAGAGDVGVLLWAAGHACEFRGSVDARPGSTVTPYDDRHLLIAGGPGTPTFIADLSNGSTSQLTLSQEIGAPRTFATATAFSGGVVVAGGEVSNAPVPNAEIFNAQSGSFSGGSIDLVVNRAQHGATLLVNGNVLLVSGVGTASGAFDPSLEVIDPVQRHATEAGLAVLQTARANPTVLTLASGEVLVAGGTGTDSKPVDTIEWFSSDATKQIGTATLAASQHEAFARLPAGGALAVISPDATSATTVWVITPDHQVQAATPIAALPPGSNVRLFDGADGAPLLWTGSSWFRWSPWAGAFAPFAEATSADGTSSATGPSADAVTASPDLGLALWVENSGVDVGKIVGLRFDARGAYSTDVRTLLGTDTQWMAPDRLPTGVTPDASGSSLTFDAEHGLTLTKNAAVVLTDATFADFSLDLDTIQLATPTLFLRDEAGGDFSIGVDPSATCAAPDVGHWHVERNGGVVTIAGASGAAATCGASLDSSKRVTIGLRGRSMASPCNARNLVVRR